jgi:outer membrane protein OmpA-like peptidoglycan-associated protein/tetratricopeptide (TPR) repeat protein
MPGRFSIPTTVLLLCIGAAGLLTLPGCARLHVEEGNAAFSELRYQDAIHHFGSAVQRDPSPDSYRKLASSHALINQPMEASSAYALLVAQPEATDEDRIAYAEVLFQQQRYAEAERILSEVSQRNPGNEVAAALRYSAVLAQDGARDTSAFELTPFDIPGIRSAFAPFRFGNTLYFTGALEKPGARDPYTDLSFTDLYQIPVNGGEAILTPGVNGPYHDGIATMSPDGALLIFTRSNHAPEKAGKLLLDESSVNNTTIFYARKGLEEWMAPLEIGLSEGANMFAHPAFSPNGEVLYFSSDMPGGHGGMDLWKIKRNGDTWTFPPVNLGPQVNSAGDDVFPSLKGNDTLFYASDAQITLGGLDILYSIRDEGGNWGAPVHLDYPLNSQSDDFGISFDEGGKTGFMSSDRYGYDRILKFRVVDKPLLVRGIVMDSESKEPIPNAKIDLLDAEDGSAIVLTSGEDGSFELNLPHGRTFRAEATMDTYFAENITLDTPEDPLVREMEVTIELTPTSELTNDEYASAIREGDSFELPEIRWDYDSYRLREEAKPALSLVADFLKSRPGIEVELRSHCDARGSDRYNQRLSERRAASAARYLVDIGVSESQVLPVGVGEGELRNECSNGVPCSEAKHQENRRTEFLVVRTPDPED